VPDPTLYLFDGYNLLHAGSFADVRELRDRLASFVALRGARGVLVFDGVGADEQHGPLQVRYAKHADELLERLAAEHRGHDRVCLVSSDFAVRGTSGQEVATISSRAFVSQLEPALHREDRPSRLADRLDERTRAALERLRRGARKQ
jgi:predicted RNA-binding protein with PIN domain